MVRRSGLLGRIRTVNRKAYSGTLTRLNSPLEIMCKFPYLALTRLNSRYLAQTRLLSPLPSGHQFQWARSVQPNFRLVRLGKVVHLRGGSVFSKLFQLDRTDPLLLYPNYQKYWLNGSCAISHRTLRVISQLIHKEKTPKKGGFQKL